MITPGKARIEESPAAWRGSKLGPHKEAIDLILELDESSPKRRSARTIREELGITDVSESTVGVYVSWRRREMRHPDRPGCRPLRGEGARDQVELGRTIPLAATAQNVYRVEDLPRNIAAKIAINPATGCWEAGYATNKRGYTAAGWRGKKILTHRLVYMLLVGPIPDGLEIDHVKARGCRSTRCCNPAHLEPVTGPENKRRARRDECNKGHEYDEANTRYQSDGTRECVQCQRQGAFEGRKRRAAREGRVFIPRPREAGRCRNGHERTPENTILSPDGKRACRECARERNRKYRQSRKSLKSQQTVMAALQTDNPCSPRCSLVPP